VSVGKVKLSVRLFLKVKGVDIVLNGKPISQLRSITCRIGL